MPGRLDLRAREGDHAAARRAARRPGLPALVQQHTLPDLVAALKGPASQPIEIDLVGRIDSIDGGIRTTFESIPDTPVCKFVLSMQGGKKGLLQNSRNLCRGAGRTDARRSSARTVTTPIRAPPLEAACWQEARQAQAHRSGRGARDEAPATFSRRCSRRWR